MISTDKKYKTRDGSLVTLTSTRSNPVFPCMGFIHDSPHVMRYWTSTGKYVNGQTSSQYDLIEVVGSTTREKANISFVCGFAEGREVQFRYIGDPDETKYARWFNVTEFSVFDRLNVEFRFKPGTKFINGFEVPVPLDKEPEDGFHCFYPVLTSDRFVCSWVYMRCRDKIIFERGLCFGSKEDAMMTAKALLGIDPRK